MEKLDLPKCRADENLEGCQGLDKHLQEEKLFYSSQNYMGLGRDRGSLTQTLETESPHYEPNMYVR